MSCCGEIRTTHHSFDPWTEDCAGILLNGDCESLPINYTAGSNAPINGNVALIGGPTNGLGSIQVGRQGLYSVGIRVQIEPRTVDTVIAVRVNAGANPLQTIALITIPAEETEGLLAIDLPLARMSVISLFIDQGAVIVGTESATINGIPFQAAGTLVQVRFIGCIRSLPTPPPAPTPVPPILV